MEKQGERVQAKNVSMYPQDWAVVRQVAKDSGHESDSGALRAIVREWVQLKERCERGAQQDR